MDFSAPRKSYFAAANGFGGFRSYFNEIFAPQGFLRLFVIKGGPGTGKSSLMKTICSRFQKAGYETEAIFCSSDASSLDGVIINSKKGKVGILDGTAPHETDAKIPIAVDEILNLGELLNKKALLEKREEVCELVLEKKKHYTNAYEHLKVAGELFALLERRTSKSYNIGDKALITNIISNIKPINNGRNEKIELFSSFGKDGYRRLAVKNYGFKKNISVLGKYGSEYLFMNRLLAFSKMNEISYTRYPSPFSDNLTDGIYFSDNDTFVAIGEDFENKIDTVEFISGKMLSENKHILDLQYNDFKTYLNHAIDEFAYASKSHFELEKIYTAAMDFKKIDVIEAELTTQITKIIN